MDDLLKPLRALGDESRVKMLWVLEDRELCSCEIKELVGLAQSTVSRHLQLLEDAGFVVSERDGLWKHYRFNPSPPPLVQGLLCVTRLAAATNPEAQEARERAATISRRVLCGGRSAA
ncbi:MAG: winged helix-turn-helix transcriptional regulator [Deltaproteobacteria bacterium]|nr:winged helix-turn-helix transcriptional regulator [Deltaproteobacteria bacterium]